MTPKERFLSVARFETPDYVPIFGFSGAPGMSAGCMQKTYERLVATGMPEHIGGCYRVGGVMEVESWYRYWGTTGQIYPDFGLAIGGTGFRTTCREEDGFEVVESENGSISRQVIDNDITYTMPEFIRYAVRDRGSWEFWRERMTPTSRMSSDVIDQRCKKFDNRDVSLCVGAGSTYGFVRSLMGPEAASLAFYDDPEMIHDMMAWHLEHQRELVFPLIERLRPEIVAMGEDLCYNHGMLVSPKQFEDFFSAYYREIAECAWANGAAVFAVDTDGNAMEFVDVIEPWGVNAIYPFEVKAGNDLFEVRRNHPDFLLFGGLEKEAVNEGNGESIEPEISGKVPALIDQGGYFPNGDHGIQPPVTFPNLCKFMTILHEVLGNPEGEFPRA